MKQHSNNACDWTPGVRVSAPTQKVAFVCRVVSRRCGRYGAV